MRITYLINRCALASLLMVAIGCGDGASDDGVVRREGHPDMIRTEEDDREMNRAIAKARETYRDFIDALQNPQPTDDGFSVKKGFPTADGSVEHIWLGNVAWDGSTFNGIVNNEPVDAQTVAFGDRVGVTPEELSDWMFIRAGRLVGGYTVRVLHYRSPPEQQRAFTQQTGIEVPGVDF